MRVPPLATSRMSTHVKQRLDLFNLAPRCFVSKETLLLQVKLFSLVLFSTLSVVFNACNLAISYAVCRGRVLNSFRWACVKRLQEKRKQSGELPRPYLERCERAHSADMIPASFCKRRLIRGKRCRLPTWGARRDFVVQAGHAPRHLVATRHLHFGGARGHPRIKRMARRSRCQIAHHLGPEELDSKDLKNETRKLTIPLHQAFDDSQGRETVTS